MLSFLGDVYKYLLSKICAHNASICPSHLHHTLPLIIYNMIEQMRNLQMRYNADRNASAERTQNQVMALEEQKVRLV